MNQKVLKIALKFASVSKGNRVSRVSARTIARGQLNKRRCWDLYSRTNVTQPSLHKQIFLMKGLRSSEMPCND